MISYQICYMSNRQNYWRTNLVLLFLGLSEVAHNLHSLFRGRAYSDTPFVGDTSRTQGRLKSLQPRGDDPFFCVWHQIWHIILSGTHMSIRGESVDSGAMSLGSLDNFGPRNDWRWLIMKSQVFGMTQLVSMRFLGEFRGDRFSSD